MYILTFLAFFACVSRLRAQVETLHQVRALAEQLIPYTADERVQVAQEAKKMFGVSFSCHIY